MTVRGAVADAYLEWIRTRFREEALSDSITELTTPFLDRHNDHLQIYAERQNSDAYLLSDDGYIVAELKSSGVETRGRRRQELISEILLAYGVRLVKNELQVEAATDRLGPAAHSLVQAMIRLDDMFVLAQPRVETIFLEDVANFLDSNEIRYSPRVKFSGKSGLDHLVDFVIPRSKAAPERVLQVANSARRDRIESLLFAAGDTRAARGQNVSYLALLNDRHHPVPSEALHALEAYNVTARAWSERESLIQELAA